jgi:NTE family protein
MGDVVEFEGTPGSTGPKRATIQKAQRRRGGRSKTALVLGGGGFTGGVYEIGALRALDLLSVNRTVNEFDI